MFRKKCIPVLMGLTVVLMTMTMTMIATAGVSGDRIWTEISDSALQRGPERTGKPNVYRTFRIDKASLMAILNGAPEEFTGDARSGRAVISLPMPDGTFARFSFEHSLVVERGLLDKFPELGRTYRGQGIDDPTATARFDFMPGGFHALILSGSGSVLINPYAPGDTENAISYYKRDSSQSKEGFSCEVGNRVIDKALSMNKYDDGDFVPAAAASAPEVTTGATLRTYRLALAATGEYTTTVGGGTVAGGLAAQVVVMNRVNGVYERDVAVHMNIIANNNVLVYTNGTTDPYTNDDPDALLDQNQANVDALIGNANYDIGHVFSTGGGGVALLGVPCETGFKAQGETGLDVPLGDDFAIDYVAHEMGHQFGADHTFNSTASSCGGGNRNASTAYEPGSGITIMGYAGICGTSDLAPHSIDTFHVKSIEEIVSYTTGAGNACAVSTASGNTPPVVTGPGNFTIPKLTPFSLTASATDANGDTLSYDWQEYDLGSSTNAVPNSDATGARPIFRPYPAVATGTRYFPSLQYILNNANVPPSSIGGFLTGELMPQVGGRVMNFQVIVRDNRAGTGGVNTATSQVTVNAASGPFNVTSPNTNVTYAGNSTQTVTWNVNNTAASPVNAANVKISYSTNGGSTFPTVLLASTPNDGSQTVTIPNGNTTTARIKVEAVGNIFFDISDTNFTVNGTASVPKSRADFDGDGKTDVSVFRPSEGNWYLDRSQAGFTGIHWGISTDKLTPGDYDGDGKTDIAVFRAAAAGGDIDFHILKSNGSVYTGVSWGTTGDIPVVGDFEGDGKDDTAVFRPSDGTWYVLTSSGGMSFITFGQNGDLPITGDFDGDGLSDRTVFRGGQWFTLKSTGGFTSTPFGLATDIPVSADYDGDNKEDIAVFRPSAGDWYWLKSSNGAFDAVHWGANGDVPVPGDYDGDGKDDQGVYRNGAWYMNRSTAGFAAATFGLATDQPIPRAYLP